MLGGKSILNLSAFATMVFSTPSQFWLMDPTWQQNMQEKNKSIPVVVAHKRGAVEGGGGAWAMHCKDSIPKNRNKYSQKW
jgi:hypothetical protein